MTIIQIDNYENAYDNHGHEARLFQCACKNRVISIKNNVCGLNSYMIQKPGVCASVFLPFCNAFVATKLRRIFQQKWFPLWKAISIWRLTSTKRNTLATDTKQRYAKPNPDPQQPHKARERELMKNKIQLRKNDHRYKGGANA